MMENNKLRRAKWKPESMHFACSAGPLAAFECLVCSFSNKKLIKSEHNKDHYTHHPEILYNYMHILPRALCL